MNKYKYQGKTPIVLPGYGLVQPGETIEVSFLINNPLFRQLKVSKEN